MNKKTIIFGIALIVIVVGIIMTFTLGFKLSFDYGEYTRISINMNQSTNLDEVKQLVGEVLKEEHKVEYTDEFSDTISIKIKEISNEQQTELEKKFKEKYSFEDDAKFMTAVKVPNIRIFDLVKEYIMPVAISFVIVILYFGIAYRKLGIYKSFIEPILNVILIGGVYVSILVIFRIPLNEYIIPFGIFIYIVSLLTNAVCLNNKSKELAMQETKKGAK